MRIPNGLGFALGCLALIVAQHAMSKTGEPQRFTDPDLIALEKIGARAKRAMDAFVLRPRAPDSYDYVCSGCMPNDGEAPSRRVAHASVRPPAQRSADAALEAPQLGKPRYVSFSSWKTRKRAANAHRRAMFRKRQLQQIARTGSKPDAMAGWEAELRR